MFHAGLVSVIKAILRESSVPDATVVLEARGLRVVDRSRPRDVVALDFFADGRHLVIDAVMTTVYMNTVMEKLAIVPGFAAKQAEVRKFLADGLPASPSQRRTEALISSSPLPSKMVDDLETMPKPSCGP